MQFSSYQQNRKQFVIIDGQNSDVEYCILQGWILSSSLFSIMINDLNKALKFTYGILYADDITILVTAQN